ncbi:MAG: protein kinase [Myxococcales bacterium]|nr:protein kinase [Myxococcales bacterium]
MQSHGSPPAPDTTNAPGAHAGRAVGRWRLVALLGSGAFGETWRAVDPDGLPAALKLLDTPPGNEMRALSRVVHPAVVGVLDAGGGARPYLAMEFVPGRPLNEWTEVDPQDALSLVAALLDALAAVHGAGLAHGDIKPANVMVQPTPQGPRLKLIDFGLAGDTQGGTLAWAAPERLLGGPSSPAADVYAAGLLLWTLLHGDLPFAELEPGEALLRRRSVTPEPTVGPRWVQELTRHLLHLDPARRPTAAAAADILAAHGTSLPQIGAELLRRRCRSVHVPRDADAAIEAWIHDGGSLSVVGDAGSGRSHLLHRALVELSARGHTFVQFAPSATAWGAATAALQDPRLPGEPVALPDVRDMADRAFSTARLLLRRAKGPLRVLVDHLEDLDPGSQRVLELVANDPSCDVFVTGSEPPSFATHTVTLKPWDGPCIQQLVEQLLGSDVTDLTALVEHVVAASGGVARLAVESILDAVAAGAVVHKARRWLEDRDQLHALPPPSAHTTHDLSGLTPAERRVGAMAACVDRPVAFTTLRQLVGASTEQIQAALEALVVRGLVRTDGREVRVTSRAAATAMRDAFGDAQTLHATIVAQWPDPTPSARLGWHLAGARDVEGIEKLGPGCLLDALARDGAEAARLSDALWSVTQTATLAALRIDALVAGGRSNDAVAFSDDLAWNPELVTLPVLVASARALHAREAFEEALSMVQQAKELTSEVWLPLVEVETQARFRLDDHAAALALARQATAGRAPADPELLGVWLRLKGIEAQATHALGELDDAIALLEALPADLGEGLAARGLVNAMLGRLLWHAKRYREAADVMAQVAKLSGGLGALDRARLANNAALASFQVGDPASAVAQWERARLLFERLGAQHSQVAVQVNLCVGYAEMGRWERARLAGQWAMEHARILDDAAHEAMAAGNLGDVHRIQGAYDDAERLYACSVRAARSSNLTGECAEGLRRLAQLSVERGDPRAAKRCEEAERYGRDVGAPLDAALAAAMRGILHARDQDVASATSALARSRALLMDGGGARNLAEWRLCSALVNEALGRTERAVTELARVVLYADEVGSVQLRHRADAVAQRVEGGKLRANGDREDVILDLAVQVAREQDLQSVLKTIAEGALALTEADRAFVLQSNPDVVAAQAIRPGGDTAPPSWTIAHRSIAEGRDVIVADLGDRPDLLASTSVMTLDLRSVMCVPLVRGSDVLGALYVDSGQAGEQELLEVGRYLRALAGYAAIAITNADRVAAHDRRIEDAAGLAHDMRNLALVLTSLAEDAREHPAGVGPEMLGHVERVGHQLVRMTDQFLRPEEQVAEPVDVVELVRQLESVVRHQAERRQVELVIDAVPEAIVMAVPDSLRRALFNLTLNAFKYCGDTGRVDVVVGRTREWVVISVQDTGPGIPPDVVPYVFDFRRQGREAREGYGIGLSVAARVVMDAGGTIQAANHPDGGAVFTVELPLVDTVIDV